METSLQEKRYGKIKMYSIVDFSNCFTRFDRGRFNIGSRRSKETEKS